MNFFQKVKLWLGIGGAKVVLQVEKTMPKDSSQIKGSFVVSSKMDLVITTMKVEFEEDYESGTGDQKKKKTFTWGQQDFTTAWSIKAGEEKSFPFEFNISRPLSQNQEMAEKGGMLGGIGKVAAFASGEKSTYYVKASIDAKGVGLDPSDRQKVSFSK
jgi:hypothetical protein